MGSHKSKLSPKELTEIVNSTLFSEDEIRTWYKSFLRDCPSGVLTLDEFKRYCTGFFRTDQTNDYAERAFKSFDDNQNGSIDFREFMCALSVTSRGSFDEKLRWAFRMYDTDNDGSVSREEMKLMIQAIYNLVGEETVLLAMPDNLTVSQRAKRIFDVMDKDGDEHITVEEFTMATKRDPSLIMILQLGEGNPKEPFVAT